MVRKRDRAPSGLRHLDVVLATLRLRPPIFLQDAAGHLDRRFDPGACARCLEVIPNGLRLARPVVSESIAKRYSRLARESSVDRRVDVALRTLDVLFSDLFLLLLLPVALVIAALVLATSGRPLFYRGERVGLGGRVFTMRKFRTLRRGAEERLGPYLGPELVARTRAETTRVGGWLRAAQLDELPQLWNVLRGDMSLVGPPGMDRRPLGAPLPAHARGHRLAGPPPVTTPLTANPPGRGRGRRGTSRRR
ncbi:MAG: sugar transferase [Actinobacteria bacterium]|nr:MAG: sugar transferase [Actinomycetota bacterium]